MIRRKVSLAVGVFSLFAYGAAALPLKAVGNAGAIKAKLTVGQKILEAPARVSLSLRADDDDLHSGDYSLENISLALSDVPQIEITGKKPHGKATGVVGFASERIVKVKYTPNGLIVGKVAGRVDFPQIAELARLQSGFDEDDIHVPGAKAELSFRIRLDKPLVPSQGAQGVVKSRGKMDFDLKVEPMGDIGASRFTVVSRDYTLAFDYTIQTLFESARQLCLQPVRIKSSATDTAPTGGGLSFGMTGANREWAKADIVFQVRPWKEVVSSSLKILSESEEASLRGRVQDDDCIEVFFVKEFSPNALHGGGATWGGGTASAQVISSDENAVLAIDRTHLAHELGHVLTLCHPGSGCGAPRADGTTNTLMCPSGFMNDNPARNSANNRTRVTNPLLTFTLKARTTGPDCTDNVSCGACP